MPQHMSIICLDTENNQLRYDGARALGDVFLSKGKGKTVGPALRKLVLASNDLGPSGAVQLVHCLARDTVLTSLNLSWNSLDDRDGRAIGSMLCKNATIRQLDLRCNSLTKSGASAIITYNAPSHAASPVVMHHLPHRMPSRCTACCTACRIAAPHVAPHAALYVAAASSPTATLWATLR